MTRLVMVDIRELFEKSALELGIGLNDTQFLLFNEYMEFLLERNRFMNLTAITDPVDVVQKHFIDSLTVIPHIKGNIIIDIGTGCGLPGVALKIYNNNYRVTLLDSLRKRIDFLCELGSLLNFSEGYAPVHSRAEDLSRNELYRDSFDTAVARAVAPLPVLLEYCLPFVKKGGVFIAMKGQSNEKNELADSRNALDKLQGVLIDKIELTLPYSDIGRMVYVFEKTDETPSEYPRKPAKITKKPL